MMRAQRQPRTFGQVATEKKKRDGTSPLTMSQREQEMVSAIAEHGSVKGAAAALGINYHRVYAAQAKARDLGWKPTL